MSRRDEDMHSSHLERRRGSSALLAGFAATLLLAACQVLPERLPAAATYDLGAGERGPLAQTLTPARVTVSAPAWLQATTMHYRETWADPGRRRAYADNRWTAAPPAMLGLVLERALGAGEGAGCRLQVQLDEFEQVFRAADRSEARLVVRFTLLPVRGAESISSGTLAVLEPATTADASGGAAAFRIASSRLADAIAQWLAEVDRALPGGLSAPGRCRR